MMSQFYLFALLPFPGLRVPCLVVSIFSGVSQFLSSSVTSWFPCSGFLLPSYSLSVSRFPQFLFFYFFFNTSMLPLFLILYISLCVELPCTHLLLILMGFFSFLKKLVLLTLPSAACGSAVVQPLINKRDLQNILQRSHAFNVGQGSSCASRVCSVSN